MRSAAARKKVHFFAVASYRVTARSGRIAASTKPGNPAPEPRSARVRAPAGIKGASWAESQKCRRQRSERVLRATRLCRSFQSCSKSA